MENFVKFEEQSRSSTESYILEEIAQKLHLSSRRSINLDKCDLIYRRNIQKSKVNPNRYYFTRDPRLKCSLLLTLSPETMLKAAKLMRYPLLFTLADQSPYHSQEKYYRKCLEIIRSVNSDVEMHLINGSHHEHLNSLEKFVGLLTDFLNTYTKADQDVI